MSDHPEPSNLPSEADMEGNSPATQQHQDQESASRHVWIFRLGVLLVGLSGVFFFSLFVVPFLPISAGMKLAVGGVLYALVQISWWIGAALMGPQAVKAMKAWFRRGKQDSPSTKVDGDQTAT